jgi:hypothetical protein
LMARSFPKVLFFRFSVKDENGRLPLKKVISPGRQRAGKLNGLWTHPYKSHLNCSILPHTQAAGAD